MNRLKVLRKKAGLTAQELAALVGTSPVQIYRLEGGQRPLSVDWLNRLAPHLNVAPEAIIADTDRPLASVAIRYVPVVGRIAAGVWKEVQFMSDPEHTEEIPIVPDQRYAGATQYALRVDGDSVNLFAQDGEYVHCVDAVDAGLEIKPGMMVHVERYRDGGQLVEATLKRIHQERGKFVLRPESSNPDHKPLIVNGLDGDEVKVRGIVVGRYSRITY